MTEQLPLPPNHDDILILIKDHMGNIEYNIGYYDHIDAMWYLKMAELYMVWPSHLKILNWQPIPRGMEMKYKGDSESQVVNFHYDAIDNKLKNSEIKCDQCGTSELIENMIKYKGYYLCCEICLYDCQGTQYD